MVAASRPTHWATPWTWAQHGFTVLWDTRCVQLSTCCVSRAASHCQISCVASLQLYPVVRGKGLPTYSTSDEDSFLFDHDLNSYAFFDVGGVPVPQHVVDRVAKAFQKVVDAIAEQVEHVSTSAEDMPLSAIMAKTLERMTEVRATLVLGLFLVASLSVCLLLCFALLCFALLCFAILLANHLMSCFIGVSSSWPSS